MRRLFCLTSAGVPVSERGRWLGIHALRKTDLRACKALPPLCKRLAFGRGLRRDVRSEIISIRVSDSGASSVVSHAHQGVIYCHYCSQAITMSRRHRSEVAAEECNNVIIIINGLPETRAAAGVFAQSDGHLVQKVYLRSHLPFWVVPRWPPPTSARADVRITDRPWATPPAAGNHAFDEKTSSRMDEGELDHTRRALSKQKQVQMRQGTGGR